MAIKQDEADGHWPRFIGGEFHAVSLAKSDEFGDVGIRELHATKTTGEGAFSEGWENRANGDVTRAMLPRPAKYPTVTK